MVKARRMKRFLEEGRMKGEKESVLPSVGKERIGEGVHIKERERGGVVKSEEREKVESSEKNKPCLTKMTTPPLACVASGERMPDREWVRSERREFRNLERGR